MEAKKLILRQIRFQEIKDCTKSVLFLPNEHPIFLLEDVQREGKIGGITAIPTGLYPIRLRKELTPLTVKYRDQLPHFFVWHIEICEILGFKDVYFHIGNEAEDSDACLLTGEQTNLTYATIEYSALAYRRLYACLFPLLEAGAQVYLEIQDFTKPQ